MAFIDFLKGQYVTVKGKTKTFKRYDPRDKKTEEILTNKDIERFEKIYNVKFEFQDAFLNEIPLKDIKKGDKVLIMLDLSHPDFEEHNKAPYKRFSITSNQLNKEKLENMVNNMFTYSYKNLRKTFEKLGIESNRIYFTSFVFSYDTFLISEARMLKNLEKVDNKLKELGIEYHNEYSRAFQVYRYRISKKASNLAKIQNIKEK